MSLDNLELSEPHPQQINRSTRTFRDQHGRPWSGIIEQRTGHWVQPLAPKFTAPIIPPHSYIVPTGDGGDVKILYDKWYQRALDAWTAYEARFFDIAHAEYKDNPGEALRKPSPWLLKAVGNKPIHPNVIRACQANNKWILGFSDAKPKWALEYFPDEVQEGLAFEVASEFPDAEEDGDAADVYPKHKGFGKWVLSNKTEIKGTREEAEKAEAAISEFADEEAAVA